MDLARNTGHADQALIDAFFLDVGRCVRLPRSERSFHVLYQLCVASLPQDLRVSLQIVAVAGADAFGCLSSSGTIYAEGVDDRQAFNATSAALESVGLRGQARHGLWRVLAAVLHLSNVRFSALDGGISAAGIISSSSVSLKIAATLLGLPDAVLQRHLLFRAAPGGAAAAPVPRSQSQASAVRDALATVIYGRVFGAVLALANASLQHQFLGAADRVDGEDSNMQAAQGRSSTDTAAAVLMAVRTVQLQQRQSGDRRQQFSPLTPEVSVFDLHGAENLASNGFHQLCANYCDVSYLLAWGVVG
jgi:myosin heavy subunit